jgi:hypothetical protein
MISPLGSGLRQRWTAWRQGTSQGKAGRVDPRQFDPQWNEQDHGPEGEAAPEGGGLSRLGRLRWALRRAFTPPRPPRPSVQGFDPRWSAEEHGESDAADGHPSWPKVPRSARPRPEANPYAAYFNEDDEPRSKG